MKQAIRTAVLAISITPVLCGSSFKNKGVQPLLDAVVDFMPSPLDVPPAEGVDDYGNAVERPSDPGAPFAALAFKVMSDPYVGRLTFLRVYSGSINAGDGIINATKGERKERIGRLLMMHANHREEAETATAGDIVAAVGLKTTTTGDTLCDPAHPVVLEEMTFPEPVIRLAIEPKTKADQERLSTALQRLQDEDPTFRVRTDEETGQTVIAGMGELHLEIIVDRLMREFSVDANVGAPRWRTARRSASGSRRSRVASSASRVVAASTATCTSRWSRTSPARATSSRTRPWVAPFPRNSSRPWTRASRRRWRAALSPASRWSTSGCS